MVVSPCLRCPEVVAVSVEDACPLELSMAMPVVVCLSQCNAEAAEACSARNAAARCFILALTNQKGILSGALVLREAPKLQQRACMKYEAVSSSKC